MGRAGGCQLRAQWFLYTTRCRKVFSAHRQAIQRHPCGCSSSGTRPAQVFGMKRSCCTPAKGRRECCILPRSGGDGIQHEVCCVRRGCAELGPGRANFGTRCCTLSRILPTHTQNRYLSSGPIPAKVDSWPTSDRCSPRDCQIGSMPAEVDRISTRGDFSGCYMYVVLNSGTAGG